MADVYAVFGTLLALGIAFPGLLTGAWLLFPGMVTRARVRVGSTPLRSFFLGAGSALLVALAAAVFNAIPLGITRLATALTVFGAFGVATLGAASIASAMGDRLLDQGMANVSTAGAFVRGAVALELAAAFPLVGWFLVVPGVLLTGLGAGLFAILNWLPRPKLSASMEPAAARS